MGPVGLETEAVALLVTGVVVQAPFVVPWGEEGPGGQVGPSEDPSGASVQVRELRVPVGVAVRQEVGCRDVGSGRDHVGCSRRDLGVVLEG